MKDRIRAVTMLMYTYPMYFTIILAIGVSNFLIAWIVQLITTPVFTWYMCNLRKELKSYKSI